jgi:hypothetical protein
VDAGPVVERDANAHELACASFYDCQELSGIIQKDTSRFMGRRFECVIGFLYDEDAEVSDFVDPFQTSSLRISKWP